MAAFDHISPSSPGLSGRSIAQAHASMIEAPLAWITGTSPVMTGVGSMAGLGASRKEI